jgi:hypothetical protein
MHVYSAPWTSSPFPLYFHFPFSNSASYAIFMWIYVTYFHLFTPPFFTPFPSFSHPQTILHMHSCAIIIITIIIIIITLDLGSTSEQEHDIFVPLRDFKWWFFRSRRIIWDSINRCNVWANRKVTLRLLCK